MNKPTIDKIKKIASLLQILNQSTGKNEPFILYDHQEKLLQQLIQNDKAIILKARQLGISTVTLYYVFLLAVINDGINVAIAADNWDNSQGLLAKIKEFAQQLGLKTKTDNTKKLVLSNGSSFSAITVNTSLGAESKAGRSRTFNVLLLSEAAYYNNSFAVLAALTSATTKNPIIILESTATAARNAFRSIWDGSDYYKHFISCQDHQNYVEDPKEIEDKDYKYLQETYGFTSREHASYWWRKLNNEFGGNVNHLLREYPVIPAHSWTAASGRFIERDPLITQPLAIYSKTKVYREPHHGGHFILGVDVAAGVGRDHTSIIVWDLLNKTIAGIYSNNTDKFPDIEEEIKKLHTYYSPHAIYVESNGIGSGLIHILQKAGLPAVEHKTNESNKYAGLLLVKEMIEKNNLCADDKFSNDACSLIYELNSTGTKETFNHPGDSLMALSFCLLYEESYKYIITQEPPRVPVPEGYWDMERSLRIGERQRKKQNPF